MNTFKATRIVIIIPYSHS